jgi:hypothetical protein
MMKKSKGYEFKLYGDVSKGKGQGIELDHSIEKVEVVIGGIDTLYCVFFPILRDVEYCGIGFIDHKTICI